MEFVRSEEIAGLLKSCGIERVPEGDDKVFLKMRGEGRVVRVHLASGQSSAEPEADATRFAIDHGQLTAVVEHLVHLLHSNQIVLVPVGKWRDVFDAVAFSLASNEEWQEFDATATVELNTRDPLLCEPADYGTLTELVGALFNDAESPNQGIAMMATSAPVLVEIIPDGALRISVGNEVLADELAEAYTAHTSQPTE